MINGHGNNLIAYQGKIKADFSTNVFNNPFTVEVIGYLKSQIDCIGNYPDPNCTFLRNSIADKFSLSEDNILVTNGSTEAFYLVAHLYANKTSIIPTPSFAEYEDACSLFKHKTEFVSNKILLDQLNLYNKQVWLANPNNPDGKYFSSTYLITLVKNNPETIFIVDEAYIDLCTGGESIAKYVNIYSNLVVIKSFTKAYAIPGIRLGYVLANKSVIKQLQQLHMPWAVSSLALKAGEFIVNHDCMPNQFIVPHLSESKRWQQEIDSIDGFAVCPSPTNYFLVQLTTCKASRLKAYLVDTYGFLIRDASNFRGLDEGWFRLASQSREVNQELTRVLNDWTKKCD